MIVIDVSLDLLLRLQSMDFFVKRSLFDIDLKFGSEYIPVDWFFFTVSIIFDKHIQVADR